jgi:hypothetical protein
VEEVLGPRGNWVVMRSDIETSTRMSRHGAKAAKHHTSVQLGLSLEHRLELSLTLASVVPS